jgi:diaminohydroxyphosphoribosylaminopyrimidine deaminase/5-amino-6-(5-phosphoribosylamino)uracil reductase
MMNLHEQFMRRCIQLAKQGAGHVAPNPMVGAVLVHESRIIGKGIISNMEGTC